MRSEKIKVSRSDVKSFLESVSPELKISLGCDELISLNSDQILENIDNKTAIGKKYYLQIASRIYAMKKKKEFKKNNDEESGSILM